MRLLPRRPMRDAGAVGLLVALLWAPFILANLWVTHDSQLQEFNSQLQSDAVVHSRLLHQHAVVLQRVVQELGEGGPRVLTSDSVTELLGDWRSFHRGSLGTFVMEDSQLRLTSVKMGSSQCDAMLTGLQQQMGDLQRKMKIRRTELQEKSQQTLSGIVRNPVVSGFPFESSGRWVMVLYGETERPLQDGGAAFGLLLDLDVYLNDLRLPGDNGPAGGMRVSLYSRDNQLLLGQPVLAAEYPCVCNLAVPGDVWRLYGVPRNGWAGWTAGLILVNMVLGLAMAVAAAVVTLLYSQHRVEFAAELARANAGLSEALEQRMRSEEARDRALADLARSRQLESVGRLAGGVAHEFNNLLQVILGHADLLLNEVRPPRPVADGLQQIDRAGRRAAELTKQLLQFARREPQEEAVVDLVAVVSAGLRLMKPALKKSTQIVWNAPDVQLLVPMDGLHLDQILLNLLLNADLAMATGGTIELRIWEAGAGQSAAEGVICEGRSVVLTVTDQGCGMSEETLSRVFDPFFSTRGPAAGTGLGLSLVYGLMRQCGGQIYLSSVVDRGTTVTLVFPSAA
ncbi:MAG: sensor histidine kinase [Planctomyces sp.]